MPFAVDGLKQLNLEPICQCRRQQRKKQLDGVTHVYRGIWKGFFEMVRCRRWFAT
jgi:hypothetical protein